MRYLTITVPPGYGSVESLADGSFRVNIPVGSLAQYGALSREFIGLGVGLMYEGREEHGDLKASNQESKPSDG